MRRLARPLLSALALAGASLATSCREPTQITLEITSDLPCDKLVDTSIVAGVRGDFEDKPAQEQAKTCTPRADGGSRMGTVVLVPSDDRSAEVAIRLVTRTQNVQCSRQTNYGVKVRADGTIEGGGCIVARRVLRYIPHTPLDLSVEMEKACEAKPCEAQSTCFQGECVDIDVECDDDGNCALPKKPASGQGGASGASGASGSGNGGAGAPQGGMGGKGGPGGMGPGGGPGGMGAMGGMGGGPGGMGGGGAPQGGASGMGGAGAPQGGASGTGGAGAPQGGASGMGGAGAPGGTGGLGGAGMGAFGGSGGAGGACAPDGDTCFDGGYFHCMNGSPSSVVCPTDMPACLQLSPQMAACVSCTNDTHCKMGESCVLNSCRQLVTLELGGNVGCMTTDIGSTHCWGDNGQGQTLPGGPPVGQLPPSLLLVPPLLRVIPSKKKDGSPPTNGFTCGLGATSVWCWGDNAFAQLGTIGPGSGPFENVLSTPPSSLAVGEKHVCAVASGDVLCWGDNASGQLGMQNPPQGTVLVAVPPAKEVVATRTSTCSLTMTGQVWCWGSNSFGECGATPTATLGPTVVAGIPGAVERLSAGWDHACAWVSNVSAGADVYCWGSNTTGVLHSANPGGPTPVLVASGVTNFASGAQHACAQPVGGSLHCWGTDFGGALGLGTTGFMPTPLPDNTSKVLGLPIAVGAAELTVGDRATCLITTTGSAYCWGSNMNGHLPFPGNDTGTATLVAW